MQYNGFISYSHAADGNLAPAVQDALHRFARPWYRLRSVWIFRDETGLAVTPSLWGTIEKALSDSEYFLLMASPEAAASHWVQKEIEWWLTNRAPSSILILLTEGEIQWISDTNDFDRSRTTALPPNLRGRMAQEPLWVDLRWAHAEEKLSLRNPPGNQRTKAVMFRERIVRDRATSATAAQDQPSTGRAETSELRDSSRNIDWKN